MTRTTVSPVGDGESHLASTGTECVADILEQELDPTIHEWMLLVEKEPDLVRIPLNFEERTGHLPKLLRDVIARLRLDKGSRAPVSVAAGHHGRPACAMRFARPANVAAARQRGREGKLR